MGKRIHVRLTGISTSDTTNPDFMENFKRELESLLEAKGVLSRPWVKEIIIGKKEAE